jgi:hypothetical protein
MPLFRRTVPEVYEERGYYMTGIGFVSAPWLTHPDDTYTRCPSQGPYDRAWQGVQKINPLAMLQYGSRHPGMGVDVPGTDPVGSPYDVNTMTYVAARGDRVNKNAVGVGAVGPGMPWMPNPTEPGSWGGSQLSADYTEPNPGPLRTILRRLGL